MPTKVRVFPGTHRFRGRRHEVSMRQLTEESENRVRQFLAELEERHASPSHRNDGCHKTGKPTPSAR